MLTPDELERRGYAPEEIKFLLDAERDLLAEQERHDYYAALEAEEAMRDD